MVVDRVSKQYHKSIMSTSSSYSDKERVLALYHQQTVQELFDDYADTFDEHLQNGLRYNVPTLMHSAWVKHAASQQEEQRVNGKVNTSPSVQKCLDLGCGTGLAGQVFRDHCVYLQGVDLSMGMCRVAKSKRIYDLVVHDSLLSHMRKLDACSFDLVMAADVFMYVLDLEAVLTQVARILTPNGWFVFSTESMLDKEEGNVLRRESERFAHKRNHVLDIAANVSRNQDATITTIVLVSVQSVELRMEEGKPVLGDIYVFQKQPRPS